MNVTNIFRRSSTAGVCLLALFAWTEIQAQEPRQPIPHSAGEKAGQVGHRVTVAGVVKRFTTDAKGEINGMVLDRGTIVRWWPHLGKRFLAIVSKGDSVRVTGRMATPERGVSALEAETITNLRTNARRLNDDTPPAPVDNLGKTVIGRVVKFTTTPTGRINGVVLSDGTVVHWQAALEKRFTAILAKGNRIEVSGKLESTPRGDTLLEARTIKNLSNGLIATIGPPPPAIAVPVVPARPVPARPIPAPPIVERPVPPVPAAERRVVERPAGPSPEDLDRRVKALEDKMDRLLKEVESLRREKQQQ